MSEDAYVMAGSEILNNDILRSASDMWGYGLQLPKHILVSQEIDSRDGFPRRFFQGQVSRSRKPCPASPSAVGASQCEVIVRENAQ